MLTVVTTLRAQQKWCVWLEAHGLHGRVNASSLLPGQTVNSEQLPEVYQQCLLPDFFGSL